MQRIAFALLLLLIGGVAGGQPKRRAVPHRCEALPATPASTPYAVRYDQVGYLARGSRDVVVVASGQAAPSYRVVDMTTNCVVASGTAGPRVLNTTSRARVPLTGDRIDLSQLRAGAYLIVLQDGSRFGPIRIADDVYATVIPAEIRFLRAQRCGPVVENESMHGACHLFSSVIDEDPRTVSGDGVAVDYGTRSRVTSASGPAVDVEGGWHDAGDFIKFTTTTSFTLTLHLLALRDHADVFVGSQTRESYRDMRREMRWGLDWLLKMIDRADPLLQVGHEGDHVSLRLPELDTATPVRAYEQRPAIRFEEDEGRNIFGRAAAAFAIASEVFRDDADYSARLLSAARTAYQRALDNPERQVSDGDFYNEDTGDDDLVLAAASLFHATGETRYRNDGFRYAPRLYEEDAVIGWWNVSSLALSELASAFPFGSPERVELRDRLVSMVEPIARSYRSPSGPGAAFHYALPRFGNGSLAESLGAAAGCLASSRIEPNANCTDVARAQLNWLFGANPFGLSFMVGAGERNPANLHHPLVAVGKETLTGAIVGGPSRLSEIDRNPSRSGPYAKWSTDSLVYEDVTENYVVNEPAIDFVAPLVYVLAELLGRM